MTTPLTRTSWGRDSHPDEVALHEAPQGDGGVTEQQPRSHALAPRGAPAPSGHTQYLTWSTRRTTRSAYGESLPMADASGAARAHRVGKLREAERLRRRGALHASSPGDYQP